MNKAQRKGKNAPNVSQRPTTLPPQYNFTPAADVPPPLQTPQVNEPVLPGQSTAGHIRNYPPPQQLFQHSTTQRPSVETNHSVEVQFNPAAPSQHPTSPIQHSPAHSHPSSQGNNFHEEHANAVPHLREDSL